MAKTRLDVGDRPTLYCTCTNLDGVAETPTNGRLLIAKPTDVTSTVVPFGSFTVEPDGVVGRVEYTLPDPLDEPGLWRVYWEFTAGIIAAEPFAFPVTARSVPDPA